MNPSLPIGPQLRNQPEQSTTSRPKSPVNPNTSPNLSQLHSHIPTLVQTPPLRRLNPPRTPSPLPIESDVEINNDTDRASLYDEFTKKYEALYDCPHIHKVKTTVQLVQPKKNERETPEVAEERDTPELEERETLEVTEEGEKPKNKKKITRKIISANIHCYTKLGESRLKEIFEVRNNGYHVLDADLGNLGTKWVDRSIVVIAFGCDESELQSGRFSPLQQKIGLTHVSDQIPAEVALENLSQLMEQAGCIRQYINFYFIGGLEGSSISDDDGTLDKEEEFMKVANQKKLLVRGIALHCNTFPGESVNVVVGADRQGIKIVYSHESLYETGKKVGGPLIDTNDWNEFVDPKNPKEKNKEEDLPTPEENTLTRTKSL